MRKQIAIVGGGYAGIELARKLEKLADVTVIEENSHFVHSVASIRALVVPELLDKVLIPYDKVLRQGKVLRGRAVAVDGAGVTLADGRRVLAHYIVLATGSSNGPTFKPGEAGIDGLRAANARVHAQIAGAKTIAIVGAGAVGTELAGEIGHHMPGKKVILITPDASLFPMMPAALGEKLRTKLTAMGVEVVFGAKAENLESLTEPYAGTLRLSTGRQIAADLIVPAIGSRPKVDLAMTLPGAELGTAGRVKADGWFRPSSLPNVFALGDLADIGDAMTVVALARQVPYLAKLLTALTKGGKAEALKPYAPWTKGKTPILIPLGPQKGASFLMLFTAGDWLTRTIKGKDAFIGKYQKMFGRG